MFDFNAILDSMFSLQTIIFAVVIYLEVLLFRKLIEGFAFEASKVFPDKYEPFFVELWREWILPAAPVVLGGLTGYLLKDYPYPEIFASSVSGRVFYAIVVGLSSGYVYPRILYYYRKFLPNTIANVIPNPDQVQNNEQNSEQDNSNNNS